MKNKSGFLIVEVLLAIVILSMIFLTLFTALSFATNRTERSKFDTQASTLIQQGVELTRTTLIANWASTGPGNYYPIYNATTDEWGLTKGTEGVLQGKFTRTISISTVCREANQGTMVACPSGAVDTRSKLISIMITWKEANLDKKVEGSLLVFNTKS